MSDFITLSCPTCGGKLQITPDIDRFACAHCGTEHIVRRGTGIVSLAPVVKGLRSVQTGVDKTAAELAIVRLKEEIVCQKQNPPYVEPSKWEDWSGGFVLYGGFIGFLFYLAHASWPILAVAAILWIAALMRWLVLSGHRHDLERIRQEEKLAALSNQLATNQQLVGS